MNRFANGWAGWARLLLALCALAGLWGGGAAQAQMRAKHCDTIDVSKAEVGDACATRSDAQFERFRNATSGALGWRDVQAGGHVWYDAVKINVAHTEAEAYCAKQPGEGVPTLDDYVLARDHGFMEVIGDRLRGVKNPLLFSSKVAPMSVGDRAVGYAPGDNDFHAVRPEDPFENAVIICISLSSSMP